MITFNTGQCTAIFWLDLEWIIKKSQPKHSAGFSDVLFEILSVLEHYYISLGDGTSPVWRRL